MPALFSQTINIVFKLINPITMNRSKLLNEFEMILSEYILVEDCLALENNAENKDAMHARPADCKCRRTCGRVTCADKINGSSSNNKNNSGQAC